MNSVTQFALRQIPVEGGSLTLGTWGASDSATTVIALHGVTGTHKDWTYIGESLGGDLRILAPDLRGRGGSADITGPWGMTAHVDDVIALLDEEHLRSVVLVGHSMGAFVAVLAAVLHPSRVRGVVLVDGGLPAIEANAGGDELTKVVLASAWGRLQVVFPTVESYLAAVAEALPPGQDLSPTAATIAAYGLVVAEGGFRIAGTYDAIAADAAHIAGDASASTLASLSRPAILLRAGSGLPPREEGLYSRREVEEWTSRVESLESCDVHGVDHGSIMSEPLAVQLIIRTMRAMHDHEEVARKR